MTQQVFEREKQSGGMDTVEYRIYCDIFNAQASYLQMINPLNKASADNHLKSLRRALNDALKYIKRVLYMWNSFPKDSIVNVNDKTLKSLDNLLMNSCHYWERLQHCPPENNAKELTALYYLIKDASEIAEATKVERYYR